MARSSSGTCSSTSAAITRSKLASAKGSRQPSPLTAHACSSPASAAATSLSSTASASTATTRAPPGGLEGVTARAAAEVEEAVAGAHPEPVVVDGQQLGAARGGGPETGP